MFPRHRRRRSLLPPGQLSLPLNRLFGIGTRRPFSKSRTVESETTAFVLNHKLREAVAAESKNRKASGHVEIDGAYFGGYVKPANYQENRRDRRLAVISSAAAASWLSCASATGGCYLSCS